MLEDKLVDTDFDLCARDSAMRAKRAKFVKAYETGQLTKDAEAAWKATLTMPPAQRIPAQKKLYSQGIPNPKVTCSTDV